MHFEIFGHMKKCIFLLFLGTLLAFYSFGQDNSSAQKWVSATINNGDTIPLVHMNTMHVVSHRTFKNARQKAKYDRLKYNVTKVYPYAKLAGDLLVLYADSIAAAETDRERKKFYKMVEHDLRAKYEKELMQLTVTQGTILIKLIDRQTGNSSYEIIKELRSSLTAFFWQSIAIIFDNNLKTKYDPLGADKDIENIVQAIELGYALN